jgi:O-antigen/teichoic acid export membrane protein
LLLTCGLAVLLGPFIVRVLAPPTYSTGGWIAMFYLLGQFWIGVTNIVVIGIHKARRTGQLLPVFGWGALLNVAVLFAAAPFIGVASAGLGFLAGCICSAYLAMHYSNRHLGKPFRSGLLGWTTAATLLLAAAWWAATLQWQPTATAPLPDAGVLSAGLLLVLVLVALVMRQALLPGRVSAMWVTVRALARGRGALR